LSATLTKNEGEVNRSQPKGPSDKTNRQQTDPTRS
jgi:hypothetical protein